MGETARQFFQPGKKWLRENLIRHHKYKLIFAALYIFQTIILEYSCRYSIWWFFFHLIVNDTLKQQTTALGSLPAIIFLMQTGILWWNGVAVFTSTKKMASPKRSLITQIRVDICRTLYPLHDNPWAYLPWIRSNMYIPWRQALK